MVEIIPRPLVAASSSTTTIKLSQPTALSNTEMDQLNQIVTVNNLEVNITTIQKGHYMIEIFEKISNKGDKPTYVKSFDFHLMDDQSGQIYNPSQDNITNRIIGPGQTEKIELFFNVPTTNKKIQYSLLVSNQDIDGINRTTKYVDVGQL
jgi:hypothetical protein